MQNYRLWSWRRPSSRGFAAESAYMQNNKHTHCCKRSAQSVSQGLCRAARSTRKVSRGAFKVTSSRLAAGRLGAVVRNSLGDGHKRETLLWVRRLGPRKPTARALRLLLSTACITAPLWAKFASSSEPSTDGATVQLAQSGARNCRRSGVAAANLFGRRNRFRISIFPSKCKMGN